MKNLFFKALLFLLFINSSIKVNAQFGPDWHDKISWDFSLEKKDDSHAYLVAAARLKKGWHVYSVNHSPDKASFTGIPTKLTFNPSKKIRLIGKLVDTKKPTTQSSYFLPKIKRGMNPSPPFRMCSVFGACFWSF